MTQDEKKQAVAKAALEFVEAGTAIGVGTGSTANYFIDALAEIKHKIDATVASSEESARRLEAHRNIGHRRPRQRVRPGHPQGGDPCHCQRPHQVGQVRFRPLCHLGS